MFDELPTGWQWFHGRGCTRCNFSGYTGRIPVAELWTPGDAELLLVARGVAFGELRDAAKASTIPMAEDVSEKLMQGRTTIEELLRTVPYSSLYERRQSSCFGALRSLNGSPAPAARAG